MDYEKDMIIDESALDVEWLNQSSLALKYARHSTMLRREERLADERVKVCRSLLIRKANEDPMETTGKPKPNAGDIEAYYRTHPDHLKAKEDWIEAAHEAEMAEIAQREVSWGRKAALENLVRLHADQYFAGPSVPRDLSHEWKRKSEQAQSNKGVGEAQRRRKK
jgi:hypothetical protein